MSRTASNYTTTIRELVTKNPELTHAGARPLMQAAGLQIVSEPPQKSAEFSAIEQYDIGSPVKPDLEKVKAACQALKYDAAVTKSVLNEASMRGAWAYEANTFNVTKFNWLKTLQGGKSSRKPTTSRNNKAKAAKVTKTKSRKAMVTTKVEDPLSVIEKLGGVQAAEAKLASLKAEVEVLEVAMKAFKALSERIQKAA